jgi:hypothetical protein
MVVQSRPSDPAREDEYNDWYSNTHVPEVSAVPGFVSARRYKVHNGAAEADQSQHAYVAIYEIDADDLGAPGQELLARIGNGQVGMSDVLQMDPAPVVTVYELIE